MKRASVLLATLLLYAGGCTQATRSAAEDPALSDPTDRFPHKAGFVQVQGGRLNYLDWGGSGPPLVMVHGLGEDPHIFDDLASHLSKNYRVVAYARRGHGSSDTAAGPFDAATLVGDLKQLMDRLGIQRASLVGQSLGGNEITAFATRYPDRVAKLVYLDAAYDWSAPVFLKALPAALRANAAKPDDLTSLDAFRTWYRVTWLGYVRWSPGLESNLRNLAHVDGVGLVRPVPSAATLDALLAATARWPRDYGKVRAPALVLYAATFFPPEHRDAAVAQQLRAFETETMVPFRQASMERIQRELPQATVRMLPGRTNMSISIHEPDALASTIRDFLQRPS